MFVRALMGMGKVPYYHKMQYSTVLTKIDIEAKIIEQIKAFSKGDKTQLKKDSKFDELKMDSLDIVELVCEIEDSFGIDLTNEEAEKVLSVPSAVDVFHSFLVKNNKAK